MSKKGEEADENRLFLLGDRVKVSGQDITGEIVRFDGAKAVVLDDDRAEWSEEDDDGTLVFTVEKLMHESRVM